MNRVLPSYALQRTDPDASPRATLATDPAAQQTGDTLSQRRAASAAAREGYGKARPEYPPANTNPKLKHKTVTITETKPANERTRHMLIWQASSVILRAMIFTCIQLFFVFKCVGVKEHRKLCFWLIVIYTMIFDSANYTIEILPLYHTSSMLQAAHMMIHAVNTFILFTIVGVFGSGDSCRPAPKYTPTTPPAA